VTLGTLEGKVRQGKLENVGLARRSGRKERGNRMKMHETGYDGTIRKEAISTPLILRGTSELTLDSKE